MPKIVIKQFVQNSISKLKELKIFLLFPLGLLLLTYSIFFINKEAFHKLNHEDGLIESLTAFFLLLTSILFLKIFFTTKRVINFLFFVVFFFGFGEEISWGQRIFNFDTPEKIMAVNRQGEFNIHNLQIFTPTDEMRRQKPIPFRYMTLGAIFLLFGFSYTLLYPILFNSVGIIRKIGQSIGLFAPPLLFGLLFLANYLFYKFAYNFLQGNIVEVDESFEFGAVLILAFLALYFALTKKAEVESIRRS